MTATTATEAPLDPGELELLAGLLSAPVPESLDVLDELAGVHPWLAQPAAEIRSLGVGEWQAEHTRLFVTGRPVPCPPFESAYREGQMAGEAAQVLTGLLERAGLEAGELPPDFLGTELALAAALLAADTEPGNMGAELANRLRAWVPAFARDLERNSHLALYRQLGRRLQALFGEEAP
jgi:TorA maturation chaperone TorD